MAKKSHKRSPRPKKDNAGCMSGFISMFDFRQGRFTQKLLSERKHGSNRNGGSVHSRYKFEVLSNIDERNENVRDTDGKEERRYESIKASVKALMAEEMPKACISNKISGSSVEEIRAKLDFTNDHEKKHKRKQSQDYKLEHSDPSENSSFDVNLAKLMVELCRENQIETNDDMEPDSKLTQMHKPDSKCTKKHYILQKAFSDITEAFLNQDSVDSKQITCHGDDQPKEFMNALETLNSNKDIFLKLLQDPNSLLFKHFLDLHKAKTSEILHVGEPAESINSQQSQKQTKHHFFRKKPSNESSPQALKRIIVLKPGPAKYEDYSSTNSPISSPKSFHNTSHFSLKEIKRRLRNVIGDSKKERNLIAMDGILHKVPYGSQNSEQRSKFSAFLKGGNNDAKLKQNKPLVANPLNNESVFYEEAKKRLAEMLSADSQNEVSSPRVSKSLCRILSLPGYYSFSPRFSPGREIELNLPAQMRSSPLQKLKQDDYVESSPCIDMNADERPQAMNSSSIVDEAQMHIGEYFIIKGSTNTEEREVSDIKLEFNTDEFGCNSESCNKEEGSILISDLGPSEEAIPQTPSLSVSFNSIPSEKFEAQENNTENLDRPSPVSVLDSIFSENINSPNKIETNYELTAEPGRLIFEEIGNPQLILTSTKQTKLKYVRTVLDASGMNCDKLKERWQLFDQLLDPFVFDEAEILYGQLIDDSKLLFDCINKVLVKIRDRYLSCRPWISFIEPNIRPTPTGEKFIEEVCNFVEGYLERVSPYTLDCVVRKDLEIESWMNVGLESEGAVFEIEEVILDYIMEETILELYD